MVRASGRPSDTPVPFAYTPRQAGAALGLADRFYRVLTLSRRQIGCVAKTLPFFRLLSWDSVPMPRERDMSRGDRLSKLFLITHMPQPKADRAWVWFGRRPM
jgi:hypothetical protein